MKNTRGKASPRGQTAPVETFTCVCFSHSERLLVANIVICFVSSYGIFVTTPHHFDLSSYDLGRFYKLACDGFAAIVPYVFAFCEGA